MPNRLAQSRSPYLLQHADNPVDWWEWGPDAFAEARRRDVPVLLSVGYAACHWCHVMAHESFEDEEVARALADGFVSVKVDREERPDVDAVYMTATQAMTGHGGWPMTCLLTPDGEPFWCGTYLPRTPFLQLLAAVDRAWHERRDELHAGGAHVVRALRSAQEQTGGDGRDLQADDLAGAVHTLSGEFDDRHSGFGTAPKFPPSMVLAFLLRHHARTGDERALAMVERTCVAMARSGTYDQLGGGFARYAVDRAWVVPHFEKMLYDTAQLVRVYAQLWVRTDAATRDLAARVVRDSVQFLLRDLATGDGAFASSLDADTGGVEGATYVWTPAQLAEVLGPEDGARAAAALRVTDSGTFEHGTSTLQLPEDPDPAWWARTRAALFAARQQRPQPARDDKVVTAWNGLAVAALADAGTLMQEPSWVAAAARCADLLLERHLVEGRLRRTSRDGVVGTAEAVAEDLGDLAEGLLALHAATAQPRWLEAARVLLDDALARFSDGAGGFHDTADDAEPLVLRPRGASDNAEPSGQSALAGALVRYGVLAGSGAHLEAGRAAVRAMAPVASTAPRFAGWALTVAEDLLSGPLQVAVAEGKGADALAEVARRWAPPGAVVVRARPDTVPVLAGRGPVDGRAAAYVCRGTACDLPVTDPGVLRTSLRSGTLQ